jgi:hypothetical protein
MKFNIFICILTINLVNFNYADIKNVLLVINNTSFRDYKFTESDLKLKFLPGDHPFAIEGNNIKHELAKISYRCKIESENNRLVELNENEFVFIKSIFELLNYWNYRSESFIFSYKDTFFSKISVITSYAPKQYYFLVAEMKQLVDQHKFKNTTDYMLALNYLRAKKTITSNEIIWFKQKYDFLKDPANPDGITLAEVESYGFTSFNKEVELLNKGIIIDEEEK